MTERRRWLRFETALNALYETIRDKHKSSSKVKNISKDGALIVVNKPLREGEEINLSVDIPGDNVPIFASCAVAWQKGKARHEESGEYETGVKFKKIENQDKGRLLEYIYSEWLKLLDRIP